MSIAGWPTSAIADVDDDIPGVPETLYFSVDGTGEYRVDEWDVYQVDLAAGHSYRFRLQAADTLADWELQLFSPDSVSVKTSTPLATSIASGTWWSTTLDWVVPARAGGRYFLAVRTLSGSGGYSLEGGEYDDFFYGAPMPRSPFVGDLNGAHDQQDIYLVTLTDGHRFAFGVTPLSPGTDIPITLTLYRANYLDHAVAGATGPYPVRIPYDVPLNPKEHLPVYCLKVSVPHSAGAIGYRITYGSEECNIPGLPLTRGTWGQLAVAADAADVRAVTLTAGQKVRFTSHADFPASADIDLKLFAPSAIDVYGDTPIASSATPGSSSEKLEFVPPKTGIYYLAVMAKAEDTGYGLVFEDVALTPEPLPPDKTPPVTSISGIPADWSSTPVTVTLSAADDRDPAPKTYYRIGGVTRTYAGPFAVSTEGTTTIAYSSTDASGNVEATKTATVRVDLTKPTLAVSAPAGVGTSTAHVRADDAVSGVSEVKHRLDGGPWASGADCVVSGAGEHAVDFSAVDLAGNVATASATVSIVAKLARARLVVKWPLVPISYGATAAVTGRLVADPGVGVGGKEVWLEHRLPVDWWPISGARMLTRADGSFSFAFKPSELKAYLVAFDSEGTLETTATRPFEIRVRPAVRKPAAPTRARPGARFRVTGLVRPAHGCAVRLEFVRLTPAKPRAARYVSLRTSKTGAYSTSIALSRGRWRVRAVALQDEWRKVSSLSGGHVSAASSWAYVTVK